MQYRNGRVSRRLTINSVLGLEDARRQARAVLGQVARGGDPVLDRRKAAEADKNTLQAICERYIAREGGKLRTTAKRHATLRRLVFPTLGSRQIDDIKRSDINNLLDNIEDQRGRAMADQVLAILRTICNWHAARDDEFSRPFVRGMARRRPEERERDRTLTDDELKRVWRTTDTFPSPWGQFIRFLLLTACRRSEAASMTWDEISDGNWTIPAERYKTGNEVTLPLSAAAIKVLAEIPRIKDCQFVFTTDGRRPISGFSTFKLKFDIACGVADWRLHDLRRRRTNTLEPCGRHARYRREALGHTIPGIRGVYDRHSYRVEIKDAFERLATQIENICGTK